MKRIDYLSWILIATGFALGVWFYGDLPDPMPTHFRADGTPDRYTALPWGAFLLPLITVGIYLVAKVLPAISPKEFSMDRFRGAFDVVVASAVAFMVVAQFILLRTAMDAGYDFLPWIQVGIGGLLLVIANYMTKTQPNFFFGIRTPWTLANEEVWFKTHRHAAHLFALTGIIMIVTAPLGPAIYLGISLMIAVAVWLVVYSYITYVRLNRQAT